MTEIEKIRRSSGIIGNSDQIEEILETIIQIAPIDISVLILGESGTGKEIIAKAIHQESDRLTKSLVQLIVVQFQKV